MNTTTAESARELALRRWRIALSLSAIVFVCYFGFILMIAFRRDTLAALLAPGLSLGIVSGALVIVISWLTTWVYVRWANNHHDAATNRLRAKSRS
ncbi:MAG: DUF485 domain-containing protein [Steroidobacteraceae bacterium]